MLNFRLRAFVVLAFLAGGPGFAQAPEPMGQPGRLPSEVVARVNHRDITLLDLDPRTEGTPLPQRIEQRCRQALLAEQARRTSLAQQAKTAKAIAAAADSRLALTLVTSKEPELVRQSVVSKDEVNAFLHNRSKELDVFASETDARKRYRASNRILAERARALELDRRPDVAAGLRRDEDALLCVAWAEVNAAAIEQKSQVSDEDVARFFKAHAETFLMPETFNYRVLMLRTKPLGNRPVRSEAEAQARLQDIQTALQAGHSFGGLIETYSDDDSKIKGGLYENVLDPAIVPVIFARDVQALPLGVVSAPMKTSYGYYLFKVEARHPARLKTYDEAKPEAKRQAAKARLDEVSNDYIEAAKKEISVEMVPTGALLKSPVSATKPSSDK